LNDGCGNGASCGGIKVRTDTTNVLMASFGDGRNLIDEGKIFIKDEANKGCEQSGWY